MNATPAALYLAGLSDGSQGMRQSLDIIAGMLDDAHDADSFPWHDVTYRESMAVRIALTKRYKPSTVNKMLSALRGVLKQTWRLGLIDADAYRRAADVENINASDLLSGRTPPATKSPTPSRHAPPTSLRCRARNERLFPIGLFSED